MHKFIYLITTESRLKIKSKYSQTHPLFTITVQREFANDNSQTKSSLPCFWMDCKLRMILYFSMIFGIQKKNVS